ncbi:C2 domain-containing protein [Melampsora americana]|nr:C2 domain-containing protein [Melampsora americana]
MESTSNRDSSEVKHTEILETFLGEMYYGTWYHNAAIIFFAVAASHYITLFGGGWSSLIIILSICATYYQTSIRRVRRDARGDVARELAKQRLFQDHETVDWLNNFFHRFWLIYEPVLSATIVASVDQVLVASTPTFLESIRMSTFTLGSKAPRIDFIRSHPETEDDVVVMDWKFDFTPNDILEMTAKDAAAKINPKIVLTIRFGKGLIGAAKDIVVENISFCGIMRVRIKLMNNFPHLQLVDLSFLEKPEFDFVLKPVGFDLNMIPGLSGFIESQVHATLGPMMYDPNVFTLNLEQMLAGTPIDSAIGVLQLTVHHARGLKAVKIGGGTPDPYVTISIGARGSLDRTKVKHSTQNPHWNSTHFLLLNSLNDLLTLEIMDYNEVRKDTSLGTANIDLQTLVADPEQDSLTIPVMHQSKARGEIRVDLTYHPCLIPKPLESGEEEPMPETTTGVVRLTLHQAKELDYKRSGTSQLSPYAKIYLNGIQVKKTSVIKRTNNPVYEVFTEVLVKKRSAAVFTVKMYDERVGEDASIGYLSVKLDDLLEATSGDQKNDWFPLNTSKTGRVRLSATWKGVLMAGAINGAGAYTPPIGVLKFWFKRAEDLKNVEALTGGKSDPYVRVMRSGIVLSRTQIHNNNLDPEFDEIVYVPVHSMKDNFRLEVMDYQHMTKDRSLGMFDLPIQSFAVPCQPKGATTHQSTGKQVFSEYLKTDGRKAVVKGRLHFEVEFHPCTYMRFSPFDRPPSELDNVKADDASDTASTVDAHFEDNGSVTNGPEGVEVLATPISTNTPRSRTVSKAKSVHSKKSGIGELKSAIELPSGISSIPGLSALDPNPIELSKTQLLEAQSGILVFNIMGGTIARKNARLEFLFVNSTEPSKSCNAKWDETGECFIRELDWSRCILKLNSADKDTREEVYAQFSCSLKDFLDSCLEAPYDFVLEDLEGGHKSTVSIQCRYIPVPITLEPRESINNMGILTVMLENAKDLMAADRNGYSDPYAQFVLNGMKVFKSNVQKKTLNPQWMEKFDVEVPSRVHADFVVQVFDWDRVGASDKLGQAEIDLKELEPMQQSTMALKLSHEGSERGVVHIKLTFRPGFITRSRQATSTFTGLGRVATGLGGTVLSTGAGVGLGAVKGVGHVGGGVIKGVGGVGRLGFTGIRKVTGTHHKRSSTTDSDGVVADNTTGMGTPPRNSLGILSDKTIGSPSITQDSSQSTPSKSPSDLKLTLKNLGASGLENPDAKPYLHIKRNGKPIFDTKPIRHTTTPIWEESFTLELSTNQICKLEFIIYDKKKLGKDKEIGSLTIDIWQYLIPNQGKLEAEVLETLSNGIGNLNFQMMASLRPSTSTNNLINSPDGNRVRVGSFLERDPNSSSGNPTGGPPSPGAKSNKSISRFSLQRHR